MSQRLDKVNELMRQALSLILQRNFDFSDVLVTVHRVDVSPDLRNAKVFVSGIGKDSFFHRLKKSRSFIQSEIAKYVVLKRTPVLHFYLDSSFVQREKLDKIFDNLKNSVSDEE